jgi:hypothetical protein
MSIDKVFKQYKYTFTREEIEKIATDLVNTEIEKDRAEEKKKAITSQMGSEIKLLSAKIKNLSSLHRSGYEYKTVECYVKINLAGKIKQYFSVETGELITTEPLEENYQKKLPLEADHD